MFGATCKGLHCACCKTYGIGPLLVLVILYVISALNKSAIVELLLHAGEILALIGVGVGLIFSACYAFLTWITKGHISSYEWEDQKGALNATNIRSETRVVYVARPGITNHSRLPLLYRLPDEKRTERQCVVLERRDER